MDSWILPHFPARATPLSLVYLVVWSAPRSRTSCDIAIYHVHPPHTLGGVEALPNGCCGGRAERRVLRVGSRSIKCLAALRYAQIGYYAGFFVENFTRTEYSKVYLSISPFM